MTAAASAITGAHLLEHVRILSSDAYEGRGPGTPGEVKTVAYLEAQCRALGLEPGAPNGGWTQEVPLWGMLSTGTVRLTSARGDTVPLLSGKEYVA